MQHRTYEASIEALEAQVEALKQAILLLADKTVHKEGLVQALRSARFRAQR
jgi:hypothetical protein